MFSFKKYIFSLLTAAYFLSCTQHNSGYKFLKLTEYADTAGYKVQIDSVNIPIDSSCIDNYSVLTARYFEVSDSLFMYGYNRSLHRIDIFSITARKYSGSIPLAKQGTSAFNDIRAIYVTSGDSLFVLDDSFIGLIDSKGKVRKRWPINGRGGMENIFFKDYYIFTKPPTIFFYNNSDGCIYVQCFDGNNVSLKDGFLRKESFINAKFIVRYNLITRNTDLLPIRYPESYIDSFYGNMTQPSVQFYEPTQNGVSLAYIFPNSSDILLQGSHTDSVRVFQCRSSLSSNSVQPLSWDEITDADLKIRHFHRNVNFFRIIRDNENSFYYRFHYDKMDSLNNDFSNVYARKNLILTILDKQLNICKEFNFPFRNVLPLYAFASKGLVYVPIIDRSKTRTFNLRFLTIKLNKI